MSDGTRPDATSVCATFVAGSAIAGAAFTVMTSDAMRDTVCASDEVIAEVARLQYSLGEGPALSAFTSHRPVLVPDLSRPDVAARWPVFTAQASHLAGALFTFPMQLGAITVGVCDTYRTTPGPLTRPEIEQLLRAVDLATVSLLAIRAGEDTSGLDPRWLAGYDRGRAQVHQATGMLTVQLGIGMTEAFGRLRAHAYAEGRDIAQVSGDIVEGRLRLEADPA